jgi:hypothetical protein
LNIGHSLVGERWSVHGDRPYCVLVVPRADRGRCQPCQKAIDIQSLLVHPTVRRQGNQCCAYQVTLPSSPQLLPVSTADRPRPRCGQGYRRQDRRRRPRSGQRSHGRLCLLLPVRRPTQACLWRSDPEPSTNMRRSTGGLSPDRLRARTAKRKGAFVAASIRAWLTANASRPPGKEQYSIPRNAIGLETSRRSEAAPRLMFGLARVRYALTGTATGSFPAGRPS